MSRVIQDTSFDSVWLYLKEIFFKILVFQPALVLELSYLSGSYSNVLQTNRTSKTSLKIKRKYSICRRSNYGGKISVNWGNGQHVVKVSNKNLPIQTSDISDQDINGISEAWNMG